MVFNGKGYVKEYGLTPRESAAMEKYKARGLEDRRGFSFIPDSWGTWMDPFYWQTDLFSDDMALVVDFRSNVVAPTVALPISRGRDGWNLITPYNPGGYVPQEGWRDAVEHRSPSIGEDRRPFASPPAALSSTTGFEDVNGDNIDDDGTTAH
ncbi:hypothetical protein GSI_12242 [Ganoderma sinense ZZ0214-1]|uniref:Uncharacterized protein n=1 Tax=Ganoderma sinense ZZ0214-1 TaxID=1077348 RepID=A0A2G8RYC0_9APHY|nr:hypothetical protein GSI_12242 [Ganoderma sinense ZZ0214-1]